MNRSKARVSVAMGLGVVLVLGVLALRRGVPEARAAKGHSAITAEMDCSGCHTEAGWALAPGAGGAGFDHDRTGFPLRSAHAATACTSCHKGQARPPSACTGCHRDEHQGRLGTACAECHRATAWRDTNAMERHRMTRMPLTGKHATAECIACHKRGMERGVSDVPVDCYACHRAAYHDPETHPDHDGDPTDPSKVPFPRDCSQCHRTSGWQPAVAVPTALQLAQWGLLTRLGAKGMDAGRNAGRQPSTQRFGAWSAGAGARVIPGGSLATSALLAPLLVAQHDARMVISFGPHRAATCESCHADWRRPALTRCDGCHGSAQLRAQHRTPVPMAAMACLGCHPKGARR